MPEIKIDPILNVHENYNNVMLVNPYRFSTGASYEPETVNYLAAVGIADDATVYYSGTPQEKTGNGFYVAVDTYIKSLKTEGVFSKLKAVYPMIGGNAIAHKWNLMNPQDTDAAFRMLWYGAGTHSKTGFKGDGSTAYGDTLFNQLSHSVLGNESWGFYSRTDNETFSIDMGLRGSGTDTFLYGRYPGSVMYSRFQGNNYGTVPAMTSSLGFYGLSRLSTSSYTISRGTYTLTNNQGVTSLANVSFSLGQAKNFGGFSVREYPYAFIGEGLTEVQMTAHYNAVQQLQTDLGRQV